MAPPLGDSLLVPTAGLTTKRRRDHASAVSLLKTTVQSRVDMAAVLWLLTLPAQSHTEMLTDHRGALQGGCGPCPANAGLSLSIPSSCGGEQAPSPLDTRSPCPPPPPLFTSSAPIRPEGQARGLRELAALPWPAPGPTVGSSVDQGEDAGGHSQEGRLRGQGPEKKQSSAQG